MINFYTSESVSCGHPDKICDQISDAILDEFLKQDKESKVACECFITNNLLVIGGEAHSRATVDIIGTAKRVIEEIGYDGTNGFNPETAVFVNTLHEQSSDIRQGVDKENVEEQGAGDQGIMFGYATNETPDYLPLSFVLSNTTMKVYDRLRKEGKLPGCRPDAKCQYTIEYEEKYGNYTPIKIDTMLISIQHDEDVTTETLKQYVNDIILPELCKEKPYLYQYFYNGDYKQLINPTGRFVIGGPEGDTGLTGRKIIVDTYGGKAPHGGGAFSGKDASKVDRSAAYYARYIAKNIVNAGLADDITIQLSYGIGISKPISINVEGKIKTDKDFIIKLINNIFNPTPYNIIKTLKLKRPIYQKTATYGHFSDETYSWEKCDKYEDIIEYYQNNISSKDVTENLKIN